MPDVATRWIAEVERVFGVLDRALATSVLPDEAPNHDDIDAWPDRAAPEAMKRLMECTTKTVGG